VASGGSNYDQVTTYLDGLMQKFGAFVTGSLGAAVSQGPKAQDEAEKNAVILGRTLAEDIRTKRDYIEQKAVHEEMRERFKSLVKMNKDNWDHEYEHWDRLNWN